MSYIKEYSDLGQKERRQLEYKRLYKADRPTWDDSMVLLTRLVGEQISNEPRVLDLGCGRGNFVLDELSNRVGEKIGLDMSPDQTTGNSSMTTIIHTRDGRLPFSDCSFDLVTSLWVLEHVEHPEQLFGEIARVLKPGGIFAFVTPNRRSALVGLRRIMSQGIANLLLEKLYGRKDDDVFPVYYRANTAMDTKKLASEANLSAISLHENADPSYTSFNTITYTLSKLLSDLPFSLTKPHLIGILQKPKYTATRVTS